MMMGMGHIHFQRSPIVEPQRKHVAEAFIALYAAAVFVPARVFDARNANSACATD